MAERDGISELADHIVREAKETLDVYVERCKNMTPEVFVREPRRRTARLSASQYAEIVQHVTGQALPAAPLAVVQQRFVLAAEPARKFRTLIRRWRKLSISRVASVVGVLAAIGTAAILGALELHQYATALAPDLTRSINPSKWPRCGRLDVRQDGCVYRTQTEVSWAYVAELLDQNVEELRLSNRYLTGPTIPADTLLVVWRYRGQLRT